MIDPSQPRGHYIWSNLNSSLASSLHHLDLTGYLSRDLAFIDLISSVQNLEHLTLIDKSPISALSPLLDAVSSPDLLQVREVAPAGASAPNENISAAPSRFTNLERLALGAHTYLPSLKPVLISLSSLTFLTLGSHNTSLTFRELEALVTAPYRPPALEMLEISEVPESQDDSERGGEGWSGRSDLSEMEHLVELARVQGIELVGNAVGVIRGGRA